MYWKMTLVFTQGLWTWHSQMSKAPMNGHLRSVNLLKIYEIFCDLLLLHFLGRTFIAVTL